MNKVWVTRVGSSSSLTRSLICSVLAGVHTSHFLHLYSLKKKWSKYKVTNTFIWHRYYIYICHACSNSHQTDNIEPLTSDTLSQSDLRSSEALWLPARGWQTGSHRWAPAPQPSGCQEDARTSLHLRRLTRRSPLSSGWLSVQPFYLRFASDRLLSHLDVTFVISDQRRYFLLTVNKKKKRGGEGGRLIQMPKVSRSDDHLPALPLAQQTHPHFVHRTSMVQYPLQYWRFI